MKQITLFSFSLLILFGSWSCNAQSNKKTDAKVSASAKVEVYYFHFTRRCATCLSVEENARKAVESLYADQVKSGEYSFKGINLDDDSNKSIADKLGVGGQTLLVVSGDKKIDITDKGFMNAHDPEKMKEEIRRAVELALKG
jgi:hypothetical protein